MIKPGVFVETSQNSGNRYERNRKFMNTWVRAFGSFSFKQKKKKMQKRRRKNLQLEFCDDS